MNTDTNYRRLLPSWPALPPRLWATAAVVGLAGLSLGFQRELWPYTPRAAPVSWAVLLLALAAAGPQVAAVLWHWPTGYGGPQRLAMLFRLAARGAAVGLLVLEGLCCLAVVALVLACG